MVLYNFKQITVVPTGKDLIDVVLSMTQRKTPTVIHRNLAIARIRSFYMRKVKYTGSNYCEKLSKILDEFPRLDDIHPFYADLMNVLYDRDHYKLALAQVNTARGLIERLAKDYVRLLKYGDSLYRCKQLKRAAMGRMSTITKRLSASLVYLEQVRQHLARLPSIDPATRTLLVCGFPNVGKSSFLNKVTRANVEVQNYPFTTKSLYVGHMDYRYLRWQVIDTPGILDHELEQRNTIEMQAITAMAHLRAAVLFFVDASEECGYKVAEQVSLFHSIKPLFEGKPLVIVVNKTDLVKLENASQEIQDTIATMAGEGVQLLQMSNKTGDGVMEVRNSACDILLAQRVEMKSKARGGVSGMIDPTMPQKRDEVSRPLSIPQSVINQRAQMQDADFVKQKKRTAKDDMLENGGAGVYSADFREHWDLKDDSWAHDIVPEIMDGKNIADYVDEDILTKLDELEKEEEERMAAMDGAEVDEGEESVLTPEERELLSRIRQKKKAMHQKRGVDRSSRSKLPRTARLSGGPEELDRHLADLGVPADAEPRRRARSSTRVREASEKRIRDSSEDRRSRSRSRARSTTREPSQMGLRDAAMVAKVEKMTKKTVKKTKAPLKFQSSNAGDRIVPSTMPRHLFSGKRGIGKTDWR